MTGAPNTGKSTLSDVLAKVIKDRLNISAIRLDGDSLRVVIGESDIEDENKREQIAQIYLNLANYLASQGFVVIVSAIAPFESIHRSIKNSKISVISILLTLEEIEAKLRNSRNLSMEKWSEIDSKFKTLVTKNSKVIDSSMTNLLDASNHLVDEFLKIAYEPNFVFQRNEDLFRLITSSSEAKRDYWNYNYARVDHMENPSSFALYVRDSVPKERKLTLFDIGCGDGRDSVFFGKSFRTFGFDISETAIATCKNRIKSSDVDVKFELLSDICKLSDLILKLEPDILYLRFLLHALNEEEETFLLDSLLKCKEGTLIFIETRTTNDQKRKKGLRISSNETFDGHYRRFIVPERLITQLENRGFIIHTSVESADLSIINNDNPNLLRIIAEKGKML